MSLRNYSRVCKHASFSFHQLLVIVIIFVCFVAYRVVEEWLVFVFGVNHELEVWFVFVFGVHRELEVWLVFIFGVHRELEVWQVLLWLMKLSGR